MRGSTPPRSTMVSSPLEFSGVRAGSADGFFVVGATRRNRESSQRIIGLSSDFKIDGQAWLSPPRGATSPPRAARLSRPRSLRSRGPLQCSCECAVRTSRASSVKSLVGLEGLSPDEAAMRSGSSTICRPSSQARRPASPSSPLLDYGLLELMEFVPDEERSRSVFSCALVEAVSAAVRERLNAR